MVLKNKFLYETGDTEINEVQVLYRAGKPYIYRYGSIGENGKMVFDDEDFFPVKNIKFFDTYEQALKAQQSDNKRWQEEKKWISDYLAGDEDRIADISTCYVTRIGDLHAKWEWRNAIDKAVNRNCINLGNVSVNINNINSIVHNEIKKTITVYTNQAPVEATIKEINFADREIIYAKFRINIVD